MVTASIGQPLITRASRSWVGVFWSADIVPTSGGRAGGSLPPEWSRGRAYAIPM